MTLRQEYRFHVHDDVPTEMPMMTREHVAAVLERDMDIAQAVVTALKWNTIVPPDRVTVAVARGWVTLKGTLEWQYQKDAAAREVRSAGSE